MQSRVGRAVPTLLCIVRAGFLKPTPTCHSGLAKVSPEFPSATLDAKNCLKMELDWVASSSRLQR
jgi:hypothetical protein